MGFSPSDADPCFYVRRTPSGAVDAIIVVYVDDIVIAANDRTVQEITSKLKAVYPITDLGQPKWLLSIGIDYNLSAGTLRLNQAAYIHQLLTRFGFENCNPVDTPCNDRLSKDDCPQKGSPEFEYMQSKPYRSAIGGLMYAMVGTRPDLAYALGQVARFSHNPARLHWVAVNRIFKYLKGTADFCLCFDSSKDYDIVGYADSDWAGDPASRRSTGGHAFICCGGAVSFSSKQHNSVALSSTEAEIVELSLCAQTAVWLIKLLTSVFHAPDHPVVIYEDNNGAISFTYGHKRYKRLKHVHIRYQFTKELVQAGTVAVNGIASKDNTADIFTKPLDRTAFVRHRASLGLHQKQ
jgi:hypothetical protein